MPQSVRRCLPQFGPQRTAPLQRAGETPIVFMPYTFYANLQAAAPEIKGQWSFAQVPGTVKEDGTIFPF